jgi:hypothetical protein
VEGDGVGAGAFVGSVGALLAGILLCAGAAKMAVPVHLSRALTVLVAALGARARPLVRLVAAAEIGTALALSVPVARDVGAVAAALLGVTFAVVGAVASVRRPGAPCGCFGRAQGRPLGLRNVAFGAVIVAMSGLLLRGSGEWADHPGLPALGAATVALLLTGWLYRDMIGDLCRPVTRARARAEMRSSG